MHTRGNRSAEDFPLDTWVNHLCGAMMVLFIIAAGVLFGLAYLRELIEQHYYKLLTFGALVFSVVAWTAQ